jgi:hypothetical protein
LQIIGLVRHEVLGGVVMLIPEGRNRVCPAARLPSVARLVVRSWAVGAVLGTVFAILLVLTNAGGLTNLIRQSPDAITAIALLVFGFATLIAGLYSGAAVMLISPKDE